MPNQQIIQTANPQLSRTEHQVRDQLAAMRSLTFELLMLDFADDSKATMLTLTPESIMRRLSWLRAQNVKGSNINVRPTGNHLTLLDDLTQPQIYNLQNEGFEPCVVVETSPANFQAWLDHGRELDREEATLAARLLAERFGSDPGAAGRRHAGRLAGFTNRKPTRQLANGLFPYVRLHEAQPKTFEQRQTFAGELRAKLDRPKPVPVALKHITTPRTLYPITRFHEDPRYGGDLSRADYAYAIYAHTHGVSDAEIEAAILQRDMAKKGNALAQQRYARYTLRRAKKSAK